MADQKIYKPRPITGFPEWLPEVRRIEQQWMDHIRKVFESYGFCSIETPSVEEIDVLSAKGEVDKEIYVLERLHKDENEKSDARLALHFDQTVPLARYVAQHFNELDFPFKRYQMQRVWRGERPQAGRFREFYQCDIDVIGVDNVPIHFDAELPAIMYEIMSKLLGEKNEEIQIRVSNRKILFGFLEAQGISNPDDIAVVTRALDKQEKIGSDAAIGLITNHFLSADYEKNDYNQKINETISSITKFVVFAGEPFRNSSELTFRVSYLSDMFGNLKENELFNTGVKELCSVLDNLSHIPDGAIVADLRIVRGLDYYTGTVYETKLLANPDFGSICSGGRYDDLAGSYINKHLPGVGISIGLSRLFDYMRINGKLGDLTRKSPTDVLVCVPSDEKRVEAAGIANTLRGRGMNVELYHSSQKIKKQMEYAVRKGIPFVWFPPFEDGQAHEVKNMTTGEQSNADPKTWMK